MMQDKKIKFKKLLLLFKPYKRKISLILFLMSISVGTSIVLPLITQKMIDNGLLEKNIDKVIIFALLSLFLLLIDQLAGLLEIKFSTYINSIMAYRLENKAFHHLMKLKVDFFQKNNYGLIMNNIQTDINNICTISDRSTFVMIAQIFKMLGGLIGLMFLSPKLTILVIIIIPIKYKIVKILGKKKRELFAKLIQYNSEYASWFGDAISGIEEIKLWNLYSTKGSEFVKKKRNIISNNIQNNVLDKLNEVADSLIINFMTNSIYIIGAYMVFDIKLTIGSLFAFVSYSVYVTGPISTIMNSIYNFSKIPPSAERFSRFISEGEEAINNEIIGSSFNLSRIQGNLQIENVCFSYDDKEVLRDLNLKIDAGEKVAIVGENGCGKSTLIKLLLRFYEPSKGRILLDGNDISNIKLSSYRKEFSVVSQRIFLFNTSILNNLKLSNRISGLKFKEATKDSRIDSFVEKLPKKYDTIIGVNGLMLSGGQRQKLAVARALMKDSKIIILDEATSNYDVDSENELNQLLCTKLQKRTAIIISHRLEVLKKVDKIVLIKNGQVDDIGTHNELYERNKTYIEMLDKHLKQSLEVS